jgi:YjbE family integral membrane protein
VLLINIAVSCDNIGAIALATRDLPERKALAARRIGILLSIALKLIFLFLTGILFKVSWLHIRILGGAMLMYVTWGMLRHRPQEKAKASESGFTSAILSIIAADASMSLDNVVAITGIISDGGQAPGTRGLLLAFAAIAASAPIMIAFSDAIAKLMERFRLLTYIFAGYLIYIAANMIFEDEMIKLFFYEIDFYFTAPAAALFGLFLVIYGIYRTNPPSRATERSSGSALLCGAVIVYSWITVAVFSFLETGPIVDGWITNAEVLYGFPPSGANAVYMLGSASGLFALLGAKNAERIAKEQSQTYITALIRGITGMAAFIVLRLAVCLIGMTFTFGFGGISAFDFIAALFAQSMLIMVYPAVFCMLNSIFKNRALGLIASMLFSLFEIAGADIISQTSSWSLLAVFFPSCQMEFISNRVSSGAMIFYPIAIASLYIALASAIGALFTAVGDKGREIAYSVIKRI